MDQRTRAPSWRIAFAQFQHASSEMKQAASTTLKRISPTEPTADIPAPSSRWISILWCKTLGCKITALHVRSDFAAGEGGGMQRGEMGRWGGNSNPTAR